MQEQVIDILSAILASFCIALTIVYLIYMLIYVLKTEKMRQDYIKTLEEHDKSVIMDYKNTFWSIRKKRNAKRNS